MYSAFNVGELPVHANTALERFRIKISYTVGEIDMYKLFR